MDTEMSQIQSITSLPSPIPCHLPIFNDFFSLLLLTHWESGTVWSDYLEALPFLPVPGSLMSKRWQQSCVISGNPDDTDIGWGYTFQCPQSWALGVSIKLVSYCWNLLKERLQLDWARFFNHIPHLIQIQFYVEPSSNYDEVRRKLLSP